MSIFNWSRSTKFCLGETRGASGRATILLFVFVSWIGVAQGSEPADTSAVSQATCSGVDEHATVSAGERVRLERACWDRQYVPGPDSRPQPEVPRGKTFQFVFDDSKIFPGTRRTISVYVPAQYTGDTPACVYVGLDNLQFEAPTTFDNLIHRHEMPITIAIGVSPGTVTAAERGRSPRFNRSLEFDGLNGDLGRFLLEEVLPAVERHQTPDGLPIRLSRKPDDRAAGGSSTGGIGAFTLAWESPHAFSRIFTASATFVGMRGGDGYPVLVRKTEPKAIRIFMQDGSHDELDPELGEVGDWWMSNQAMQRSLEFAGYQVKHAWGVGPHGSMQATVVFPEAMRWLWKDWPQPVKAGESRNTFLREMLRPEHDWEVVPGTYQAAASLAADHDGAVFFWDSVSSHAWKVSSGGPATEFNRVRTSYTGMAVGPDGNLYVTRTDGKIVRYGSAGEEAIFAKRIRGASIVVSQSGDAYVTESGVSHGGGKVWHIDATGKRTELDSGLEYPTGIALSPDGAWLSVAESRTHWGYSYRLQSAGAVQARQRFYRFHVPDDADDSGAGAWVMDREGRLYAATRLGVQVFDRNGRVRAILPLPGGQVTSLSFGGAGFDTLYASCADHKVYRRVLKVSGAQPWGAPVRLPPSGAG